MGEERSQIIPESESSILRTTRLTDDGFSPFKEFPFEIQQKIVSLMTQRDLLSLSLTSKLFYKLASKILYSKIYLNDSCIEHSKLYTLASTYSWFHLPAMTDDNNSKTEADSKLKLLIRSFRENLSLTENVIEIRLNWDLDIPLQQELVKILTEHSKSLKIIENITNTLLNDAIEHSQYRSNLISLDLPPPFPLPSTEIPNDYLSNTQRYLIKRLTSSTIKHLTIFMDPLLLFNNVVKPLKKLEIENFKLHCRSDAYSSSIYRREGRKFKELSEIFDTRYLKVITIISWFEFVSPDENFKFDQWEKFKNLEDITLIAVPFNDVKISNLINNCHRIKRLKLDFLSPRRELSRSSLVYQSIFKHSDSLEFLDVKLIISDRIVNLDVRHFTIFIKIFCKCSVCQEKVLKEIFQQKIFYLRENYKVESLESYIEINIFEQFFSSNLLPYSKAVDKFPSVKTGPGDIKQFIDTYNDDNSHRSLFKKLDYDDFYPLYHCLIHSLKKDLDPFITKFSKLKFLVLNDISFMIKMDEGLRYPVPLFYSDGFKTNFKTKEQNDKALRESIDDLEAHSRPLYLSMN